MAFTRCRCGHYDDQHDSVDLFDEGSSRGPCRAKVYGESLCRCCQFTIRGNAPEGTGIYRSDDPLLVPLAEVGYHVTLIPNGTFGEVSKIEEELAEFKDALAQKCSVMAILELADLIGAIEGWLDRYHPSIELGDLLSMTAITKRAFQSGHRQLRED